MDLKSSIIDFMRDRPFLWNSKHPNYKDHKRREQEFQAFSKDVGYSIQEIKRVWHVLRTNFFRAHKLLQERPVHNQTKKNNNDNCANTSASSENGGEKLWKYYLAMEYILEGSNVSTITNNNNNDKNNNNNDETSCSKDVKPTHSLKSFRDLRGSRKDATNTNYNFNTSDSNNTTNNATSAKNKSNTKTVADQHNNNLNTNSGHSNQVNVTNTSTSATLCNDSLMSSLDAVDDDHLYARSLTSTLKRFDPTTKEVIKLKFQEIIVDYMQRQQRGEQHETGKSDRCEANVAV